MSEIPEEENLWCPLRELACHTAWAQAPRIMESGERGTRVCNVQFRRLHRARGVKIDDKASVGSPLGNGCALPTTRDGVIDNVSGRHVPS